MMKRMMITFILLFICVSLSSCVSETWYSSRREKIFYYVNENYEILKNFPYEEWDRQHRGDEYDDFIKEHLGSDTIVTLVYMNRKGFIEYSCYGLGNATGSTYIGFYYSENDLPYAFFDKGEGNLEEIEPGVLYWQDDIRKGRSIRTEKIRDNWWYYILKMY